MFYLLYTIIVLAEVIQSIPLESIDLGHCGKMNTIFENVSPEQENEENDVRIVGGYDAPEPVPWFVMLKIDTGNGTKSGFQCGATLITSRFILTAAHCICNENVKYCATEAQEQNIDIVALLGLTMARNLHLLSAGQKSERHLRHIIQTIMHQNFEPQTSQENLPKGPDIALLKMDRPVPNDFKSAPACLPASHQFPDTPDYDPEKSYNGVIIGIGNIWDIHQACVTSNGGPNPFQTCKFPFISRGQENRACVRSTSTPSATVEICRQFHEKFYRIKKSSNLAKKYRVQLIFENGTRQICYDNDNTLFGWCGVCLANAKPGEEGYCPEMTEGTWNLMDTSSDLLKEATKVKPTEKWGWCHENCWAKHYINVAAAPMLQVAHVDILSANECEIFGRGLRANSTFELCAGKKVYDPILKQFRVKESNGSMEFIEIDNVKEQDWIIGGQDSCHGDSGGPLWIYLGTKRETKRAFLIGIVSRGDGCANFNKPGVYTAVKQFLDWIQANIDEK